MAGKGNTLSAGVLKLIFQAVGIANLADNTATSPLADLYVSLHTADPGPAGSQTTSEVAYTGYARVAVARTTSGWAITGETIDPVAQINFPSCTGGSATAAFFGVGTASTGAGVLLYSGAITPNISIASGVTPELTTASAITES